MPKILEVAKVVGSLLVGGIAGGAVFAAATMFVTYIPAGGTPQHSFVPSNLMWTPFFAIFSVPIALAAGRLIANQLYGLPPHDPMTFAVAVAVLLGVSTVAAYLPARRAARVDPMIALREE